MTDVDVRGSLLQQIKDKAVVHGKVTLSSGLEADYYVDLRRVTLDGEAAPLVGQVLLDLTADLDFDAVGGLTMGADPVAGAMLHAAAARAAGWTPSSSARRPRRTDFSGRSRVRRSRAAAYSSSRTPPPPAAPR